MGPLGCPETSVINSHSALREIPKERRYKQYLPISLCERVSRSGETELDVTCDAHTVRSESRCALGCGVS